MPEVRSEIWVIAEQHGGQVLPASLELLAKARELAAEPGWSLAAVLLGQGLQDLARELLTYGVDEVLLAQHELLTEWQTPAQVKALAQLAGEHKPQVILAGATASGVDLAPRLAARLKTGLSAHCVDLEFDDRGGLFAVVPGWGGSIMAKISCPTARPQMATVLPGVFAPAQAGEAKGQVIELAVDLSPDDLGYKVLEKVEVPPAQSALDGAEVVVAGGWGLGNEKDWQLLPELAQALGGAVGSTRPPVDEGWAQENQMIGTSGRSVSPKLYIGVALSGNAHHLVGIKNPGLMVGINKDPQAAIFDHCDLGLVGEAGEILPALLEELRD